MRYVLGLLATLSLLLAAALLPAHLSAQERTIQGTVVEELTGEPVDFPQIAVRGTQIGTVGDADGSFVLRDAPAGDVTLLVQRIGFRSREVTVPAGETTVTVRLVVDHLRVEELVVTGRATQIARQNLAHSIATLTGDEVMETPQQTVDRAIQGKVTGAIVSANSGAPGGGLQVQLRGVSSINAASEPLYVVDGVLMSNAAIPSNQNAITAAASGSNPALTQDNQVNRIADLNPEDIESIEILKGASAAAIYGSKASNGVVIVTTRRGQAGATRFRARASGGFFDLSNKLGFRTFESMEEAVGAFGPGAEEHFVPGQVFDQEELLAGRNDLSWDLSGSASGGTEETQYFASGLWKEDEGIVENTFFDRQSLRANLRQRLGARADVNVNTGIIRTAAGRGLTNNDNSQTSYYMVYSATPSFVDLRQQPDGTFPRNPFVGNGSNPLQTAALLSNDETVFRLLGSVNADLRVIERDRHSLVLNAHTGADWFNQENAIVSPPEVHFEEQDGLLGTSLLSNSNSLNFNAGSNLIFTYAPGPSTFTTSVGLAYERQELRISRLVGQNLTGGKTNVDAGSQRDLRDSRLQVEDFGFFVQQEWLTLDDRLFLSGAVRFDQSSTAGDSSKVFLYPKGAASFRFPELGGALDEVKVRAAVGQTGNQPLFGQTFTILEVFNNIEGIPGFAIEGTRGDPNIELERQTEVEGGIDATAWGGRGTLELTGYHQWITNMILERRVAPSTGFITELFNGGELRAWGFEAALGLTPVAGPDLTWVSRTSFGLNRTRIQELPVPGFRTGGFGTSLGAFFVEEGESSTQIVGTDPTCTGPDPARPECRRSPGLAKMGDANPDFVISFANDVTFLGNFRLYGLLDWRQGFEIINLTELLFDAGQNSADFVPAGDPDLSDPASHVNQCHPDCSGLERLLGFASGNPRGYVQSGSFLKLREVSLSYDVPDASLRSLFGGAFSRLRLTLSGRDLASFTPYGGLDPEVSNFGNQQISRNVDVAPFPPSRSWWLTADVTF